MASFIEELWNSIFTPGATPTLLVATNASFAALQFVLLLLLLVTYSIHFLILSLLSAGLWYAINWFARELQIEKDKAAKRDQIAQEKLPDTGNDTDTETEITPPPPSQPLAQTLHASSQSSSSHLHPDISASADALRRRQSLPESSGDVSTDSEWEKVGGG